MSSATSASKRASGGQKRGRAGGLDGAPGLRRGSAGWLALLGAFLLLPALAQFEYVVPDSAGHVAYARSLLYDRDLRFDDDYARLGMIEREGNILFGATTAEGRPGNPFGIGSALLWLPWLALAAALARVASAAGAPVATDGFGTLTLWAVHLGTWSCAGGALMFTAAALRAAVPQASRAARRTALAVAAFGTPFYFYVLVLPSYSHVCAAFAVAVVTCGALCWRTAWTPRRAVALGAAVGFAALVRAQDAAFLLLPVGCGLWGGGLHPRRDTRCLALYTAGFALAFAPQLLAWKAIYGAYLQVPQGASFLHPTPASLSRVLLASRHGLLAWSPVVAVALVGLVALARAPRSRGLGLSLLAAFLSQWIANALPVDWWAGWSFGARRFVDCLPLFALGLAVVADRGRLTRAVLWGLGAAGALQGLRMASRALSGEVDPGWGQLWGGGFWGFLPRAPGALVRVVSTPWTEVQILRRPQSTPPDFHADPTGLMVVFYVMWAAVLLAVVWIGVRRSAPRHQGSEWNPVGG